MSYLWPDFNAGDLLILTPKFSAIEMYAYHQGLVIDVHDFNVFTFIKGCPRRAIVLSSIGIIEIPRKFVVNIT